ncbi:hypothetical protein PTKIN_Ptkin18bG0066700 [Pterospermum kingtungense]
MLSNGDIENIVDSRLQGDFEINSVRKATEVAMACLSPASSKRPTMDYVVMELSECFFAEIKRTRGAVSDDESVESIGVVSLNFGSDITLSSSKSDQLVILFVLWEGVDISYIQDDLKEKLNNITIDDDEEDDEVTIDEDWVDDRKKFKDRCLIGKMFIRKPYSLEAMRITFIKAWRVSPSLDIKEIGDRLFLFCFDSWMEKAKVLVKQP